ncbi:aldehyde dehydrogenase family 2 member C4-like [Gossypium australe]|uniref:Aldehyde dehydrogenase family 2 member C4-like n=1 Tax=Gossypium australe TaxID=47621 RepID=A0A5B6X056_9ROSI|nr:aldehyde dehydrogenase family 2 member C4-like [Gossypium australe]
MVQKSKVIGRIEIPLLIGPNTYEVEFSVMDIKPSYNCMLGRPWIHSAGAVPSSLHQKMKLVMEVTHHIRVDEEAIECFFRSLEFVNATFIVEGNKILVSKISKTTRWVYS